jgi:hemoglobin/transferrin/lactoferrin receptor protein
MPVEHVAVFNQSRDRSTLTDTLGWVDLSIFQFSDTILFQHPSYLTSRFTGKQLAGVRTVYLERKSILIDEYVISASKSRENTLLIPYVVDVLEIEDLKESTGLTSADILEGTGNILVQKTQGGGGSPILRGFEANKILLVVDGVRLNNAIYRNGHLQNAITIDHAILDRAEVIFGPAAIIYGSDALGGVIHYYTRDPEMAPDEQPRIRAHAYTMFSSASNGINGHLDFSAGGKRVGSLTSITYKYLGDIRMGSRRSSDLGDWGLVKHYVDRVNGTDSTLVNDNPLIQKRTGYSQTDILQKIIFAPSRYVDWILNLQYSTSFDIDRFDNLNDYSGENLKYAEYYYGPQDRVLVSLKNVVKKDNSLFTNMTNVVAFQKIDEDRYSRRFRVEELLTQLEEVYVFSFNTDLLRIWGTKHKLHYGAELDHNRVGSEAWYENTLTGSRTPTQTRYPDGGSLTWNASVYASYKWMMRKRVVLNGGVRYSRASLSSEFTDEYLPFDRIDIKNGALTGSLGVIYTPSDSWQINSILATGFRNPNVDDYGKVRAQDGLITVPNEDLRPEYTYHAELGINRVVADFLKVELSGYYSYLRDVIVRTDYQLNGQDSLDYDGERYRITTNYNAGRGYIYGASLRITSHLSRSIDLDATLNYTKGHNLSDDVPLGHIPPLFGRTSVTYRKKPFFLETYLLYQGWKRAEDFSPFGEDNEGEAMEDGFPSWWTLNIKYGFSLGDHIGLMVALENLFDRFYKPYASGISAPGMNFILTARFTL